MKHALFISALPALLFTICVPAIAQQTPASPGFTYNMKLGTGQGTGMDISMAVTVTSTDSGGARSASIVVGAPKMPPLNGKKVGATISPAGEITIASTGELTQHFSPSNAKAMSDAAAAPMLQMMLDPLNVFAAGCGAAPSHTIGASWHLYNTMTQADVVYTITGHERRSGRDTLVITMATPSAAEAAYSGKGNYDPAQHLVDSVHVELRRSGQGAPAQVVDAALNSP